MQTEELKWYVPGSVLSALWGSVMPRLAATVWKGDLKWPPNARDGNRELIYRGMYAYPVTGTAQKDFWTKLRDISFGSGRAYRKLLPALRSVQKPDEPGFTRAQRAAHAVLEYFHPNPEKGRQRDQRLPLRVVRASAYDFVLSSHGLDVFIPDNPFENAKGGKDWEHGRTKVLQMYKFRKTGRPPIGLPGLPASSPVGGDDRLIPIPQLTSPTGAFQIHEDWARGRANDVAWWISGTAYRGIMAALPRVIAYRWYEEVAWKEEDYRHDRRTTRGRFRDDIKTLLEERTETRLPADMKFEVRTKRYPVPKVAQNLAGWNPRDVMITNEGLCFPDPGTAPAAKVLLDAIEAGKAGNPVFTDSGPSA
jgi:hypothetical protein